MSGSSIPAAISWLVSSTAAALTANGLAAESADGYPTYTDRDHICWGRTSPDNPTSAAASSEYGILGHQKLLEAYTIPGYIYLERPGPGYATARNDAFTYWNLVTATVHTDPSLGGALLDARLAQFSRMALTQGISDRATAGQVTTTIEFEVVCRNQYQVTFP